MATTILFSFVAMYSGLGPFVSGHFGIDGEGILWIRISGIPSILLSLAAGTKIKRFGSKIVLICGLLLAGVGLTLEALSGSLTALVLSSVVFVAGIASAIPGFLVLIGQLSGNARGSAAALYAFFVFVGASLGPLLAAGLLPYGFVTLCCTLAAVLFLAALVTWLGIRTEDKQLLRV